MDKISIIVPCYNEEEMIPIFYKEFSKTAKKLKKVEFEVIYVNDGSSDNSLREMKKLSKEEKCVKYISFSRNFGKEAAMLAGLEHASGDYIAIMDVDLQDPPEMIEVMYNEIKSNEDLDCIALKTNSHDDYGFVRKFFTNLFYKIISKMSKTEMVPGARDFRLMKRQMVDAIISMGEYNRYSKGLFSFVGFNTKWLTYKIPERKAGKTTWNFFKLCAYAIDGILAFTTTPLTISAFIGVIFCLLSVIAIIVIIVKTLMFGDPVDGWPSIVCIMFFLSGIQLFCTGIIGAYLSKTYTEVKKRPIYIIREQDLKQ